MLTRAVFTLVARRNTSTSEAHLVVLGGGLGSVRTHSFLWGHSRAAQTSSSKMGVSILTKGAESVREERRRLFRPPAPTPWPPPHP